MRLRRARSIEMFLAQSSVCLKPDGGRKLRRDFAGWIKACDSLGASRTCGLLPDRRAFRARAAIESALTLMQVQTQPAHSAPVPGTTNTAPQSYWQVIWLSPAWMVLVAFAVRMLWIGLAHTYRFRTNEANFGFGWEIGRI